MIGLVQKKYVEEAENILLKRIDSDLTNNGILNVLKNGIQVGDFTFQFCMTFM